MSDDTKYRTPKGVRLISHWVYIFLQKKNPEYYCCPFWLQLKNCVLQCVEKEAWSFNLHFPLLEVIVTQ